MAYVRFHIPNSYYRPISETANSHYCGIQALNRFLGAIRVLRRISSKGEG